MTTHWAVLQGGTDVRTLEFWLKIFLALELDRKAQRDLLLLAHSGICGRAEANEVLWKTLAIWALRPEYEDLSHRVSHMVGEARMWLDRPPSGNEDLRTWRWANYSRPRHEHFSPLAVPPAFTVLTGPGGEPLPPPRCWGPLPAPQEPGWQ